MSEDALADDEGKLRGWAGGGEVGTDGGEGFVAEDFGDYVGDVETETKDAGKDDHQVLVGHLH